MPPQYKTPKSRFIRCKKEEYALPVAPDVLQSTTIKKTLGPNIVTQTIDFAYAATILPSKGKLTSIQVEASIGGVTGTFLENRSFYTNGYFYLLGKKQQRRKRFNNKGKYNFTIEKYRDLKVAVHPPLSIFGFFNIKTK